MTDIVERLRQSVTKGHEPTDDIAIEAADEIERLRAALGSERERYAEIAERVGDQWGGEPAAMGISIAKQIRAERQRR